MKGLNLFLDNGGLIRVGGRLEESTAYTLPKCHKVIKLIILQEHYKFLHAGPQALFAHVRLRYWPLSGRQTIRSVLRSCIACFKVKPSIYQELKGVLPKDRVTPCRPFLNCGVDYAGPFTVKVSKVRSHTTIKV